MTVGPTDAGIERCKSRFSGGPGHYHRESTVTYGLAFVAHCFLSFQMVPEGSGLARAMRDEAYRDGQWAQRYIGRVAAINRLIDELGAATRPATLHTSPRSAEGSTRWL
jgi:hypothetical protein